MGCLIYKNNFAVTFQKQVQGQDVISVIENAIANEKVFLVLDDVDSFIQLDALLGKRDLCPGSKIIITAKNASLTHKNIQFKIQPKHTKYFLTGLYDSASLQLLSFHAFGCAVPKKGYEDVSGDIVKYSEGHPLALEVLDNDKELFKYIACFFVGKDRDFTEIVLKACGINTRSGTTNLIQRCLVSINLYNELKMHSLIQDIGRDFVRQKSPNKPWMRSRL
ncbi:TMV resistance protein N-like protein [Tanacetum coccineum]